MSSEQTVAPPAADINDALSKNIQEIKPSPIIESTRITKDEKEPDEIREMKVSQSENSITAEICDSMVVSINSEMTSDEDTFEKVNEEEDFNTVPAAESKSVLKTESDEEIKVDTLNKKDGSCVFSKYRNRFMIGALVCVTVMAAGLVVHIKRK